MTCVLLLAIPFVAAALALALPDRLGWWRRLLPPLAALCHAALTARLWLVGCDVLEQLRPWLAPDAAGLLFLSLTSAMFLPASLYAVGDLRRGDNAAKGVVTERIYVAGLLFFLAAMTAVCMAQDMGLLWVALEATTLATAPLITFRKSPGSLEATWKYMLICSVGIALALLGTFLMAVAAGETPDGGVTLRIRALADLAPGMDPSLLKAAFIFLLVGYGAKMGLAPMHTWLPDAYAESASPVWPLLSGTLLNGAFLALLRSVDIMQSAGMDTFANDLLRLFGLLSMGVAGAFIVGQKDYKRMLAYSSVEHMGILAFGIGLGGAGLWAALLHAVNHALIKGSLFLTAGNIMHRYRSKAVAAVSGLRRGMPVNGILWLAGLLAICGLPPFGLFFSEFAILAAAFAEGRHGEGVLYLLFLAVVFVGMLTVMLAMLRGESPPLAGDEPAESVWMALPALAMLALPLALGFGLPAFLSANITEAAHIIDQTFFTLPGIRP